jgi:outer membrane lipoprotein-sorting protein
MGRNQFGIILLLLLGLGEQIFAQDARAIMDSALHYYRGNASVSVLKMTIHRPNWERNLTIKAWTRGNQDCIFFITAPPKDEGNGTLKLGRQMWTYNPKIDRVIKLPPSMMSQAWMGSDFSNEDLSKTEGILEDYAHTLLGIDTLAGYKQYLIESIPKPGVPVVWGRQCFSIREDYIILRQEFYDEDSRLVKVLSGREIGLLGGRLYPRIWEMRRPDSEDEYTILEYVELNFLNALPDRLFKLSVFKSAIK